MSDGVLLLLGGEAEALAPRLEASGYRCLVGDQHLDEPCDLAVLGADWGAQIADVRQRLGATPLLLDIGRDSVSARSELLRSGADDFWLSSAGASELLTRLRLHRKLLANGSPPPIASAWRTSAWCPAAMRCAGASARWPSPRANTPCCCCCSSTAGRC